VSTSPKAPTPHDRWTEAENRRLLLELMRDGVLDVTKLISDVVPPSQGGAAFADLADHPAEHLGIAIDWSLE
jgi:threonine dehydrogenase-like Zn-dependent dehydrogenase